MQLVTVTVLEIRPWWCGSGENGVSWVSMFSPAAIDSNLWARSDDRNACMNIMVVTVNVIQQCGGRSQGVESALWNGSAQTTNITLINDYMIIISIGFWPSLQGQTRARIGCGARASSTMYVCMYVCTPYYTPDVRRCHADAEINVTGHLPLAAACRHVQALPMRLFLVANAPDTAPDPMGDA